MLAPEITAVRAEVMSILAFRGCPGCLWLPW